MFAKKNVVAAAALTLLAVAAHAQVTVYGTLDASIGRKQQFDGTVDANGKLGKTSSTNVDSSDMSQSFIGFKGQEDLGGGLKAVFKLESELGVDTGRATGDTFWNRNATVGLAGDFGAFNLGRFENLFKLEGQAFNPFGASATFSPTFRASGLAGSDSWSNGISYVSPNLGGLTLSAQYSAKEAAKATATSYSGGAVALSANYTAGPLGLSAVIADFRSADAATAAGPAGPAEKGRPWLLGASYDFGILKLYGQYGQEKTTEKGVGGSSKLKGFQVGAGIPVAADGTVLVSYGEGKTTFNTTPASSGKARDFSLGYTHNVSKRTNVYAALINERASATVSGVGTAKGTINSFAVGVRHAF